MEASYLLAAGSAGGLATILLCDLLRPLLVRARLASGMSSVPAGTMTQILEAVLHSFAGAGMGLLFWLSWGLTAIVNVAWWQRGTVFGVLCWLVLAVPVTLSTLLSGSSPGSVVAQLSRWLCHCLLVGLLCGWCWQRLA